MTVTSDQATTTAAAGTEPLTQEETIASLGHYGYGWSDSDEAGASAQRGLSEAVVRDISAKKSEPEWMLQWRLEAYERWLPLINYENRQGGILTAKALMKEGGVIACEAGRHPFPAMNPHVRTGLLDAARRLDPMVLRWGR